MATAVTTVPTTDTEDKWRREQRWRELQAMEEEQLRGELSRTSCSFAAVYACRCLVQLSCNRPDDFSG